MSSQRNSPGQLLMGEKDLPDWETFENEIRTLRSSYGTSSSPLLFRGQPNSEFSLTTTLERAGCEAMLFDEYYLLVSRVRPAIETFTGVKWEVPDYNLAIGESFHNRELFSIGPGSFPSVELYRYLVYLRHHGFPSPLLDWSRTPNVAAFFAFRDLASRPDSGRPAKRSIYVYCEYPKGFKGGAVGEPAMRVIGPYIRSHPRHFRQQSDYTISAVFDEQQGWKFHPHESVIGSRGDKQDALWKFNLPSSEGAKVLALLNQYNLSAFSLFDSDEALLETMWFQEHVLRSAAPARSLIAST
jgi:FRG domain